MSAWLVIFAALAADGPASGGEPPSARPATGAVAKAEPRSTSAAADKYDHRDVVLLLDSGPLHIRLHVGLGGTSLAEARRQCVERLMKTLDADGDGKLSRDEAAKSPLFRTKSRPRANAFLESLKAQAAITERDVAEKVNQLGGELVAYREDLTSAKSDLEVFKLFDADSSSVLDQDELLAAAELMLEKDGDGDQCVSFEEFFPPPPPPDPMLVGLVIPEIPPIATHAEMVGGAQEPTMPAKLRKKYDKRRDLKLTAEELGWSAEKIKALDADGSGDLDTAELQSLSLAEPDLDLSADLKPVDAEGGVLLVHGTLGERLDDGGRPDYVKVRFASAVITFSLRNLDPFTYAIDDAMRQFNLLDADANGYLDRDETAQRVRFERGLFELIDVDGDDKVFADEIKEYVRARAEPAATTCKMNVYDTGNGFFMALDANADGRVSERERRNAAAALAQLDRDGQLGVSETEPVRHFHVEFVRGTQPLFGPSEQLVAQTPAFQQRRPTGPIWFQRMDRNNDGDLSWDEFLGPLPVFESLDADRDGLLDPNEAAKAN